MKKLASISIVASMLFGCQAVVSTSTSSSGQGSSSSSQTGNNQSSSSSSNGQVNSSQVQSSSSSIAQGQSSSIQGYSSQAQSSSSQTVYYSSSSQVVYFSSSSAISSSSSVSQGCGVYGSNMVQYCTDWEATTDNYGASYIQFADNSIWQGYATFAPKSSLYSSSWNGLYMNIYQGATTSTQVTWWGLTVSATSPINATARTISVQYQSTSAYRIAVQDPTYDYTNCGGTRYYYLLPSTGGVVSTVTVPVNTSYFHQPSWVTGSCVKPLNTSQVNAITFTTDVNGPQTTTTVIYDLHIQ